MTRKHLFVTYWEAGRFQRGFPGIHGSWNMLGNDALQPPQSHQGGWELWGPAQPPQAAALVGHFPGLSFPWAVPGDVPSSVLLQRDARQLLGSRELRATALSGNGKITALT